jgi:hypothetical protein
VTAPWLPPGHPRTRASQTQCEIGLLCGAGERRQDDPGDACFRVLDNNLMIILRTAGRSGLMPSEQPLLIAACEERRARPAPRVQTSLVPLLPQATSECLSGLDVQGRSFPQQIRPLPERAKIKLMALLPRCPVTHKLLRPFDVGLGRGAR